MQGNGQEMFVINLAKVGVGRSNRLTRSNNL